jgi:hypothetical protein
MGPRAGLDGCEKSHPHWDSIPGQSSPWSVAIPTELPGPQLIYHRIFKLLREQLKGIFSTENIFTVHKIFPAGKYRMVSRLRSYHSVCT